MTNYEKTRRRHIEHMLGRVGEHLYRLTWSAERLREERTARLRELITVAKARSAWHRHRLKDVDPQKVDEDGLRELPAMSKTDLMAHFDAIVTEPRVTLERVNAHIAGLSSDAYFLDELHAVASGGSSGVRGAFVWGWEAWATARLALLRRQLEDRMSDPDLSSRPPVMMLVAADNATHFTSALAQTFATEALQVHRFPVSLPLEEIVEGLNRVDGDSLATYSSMLATLAAEAQAGRLRIQPQRIATTAEPLLPEIRRAAQQTWGAPIANVWGTSEGGTTALGCYQDSGMHLSDDLVIVEPVDSSGEPVAPGTPSAKVYLTNLVNPLLPLIRYEITDEVTLLDDPCVCGSAHRRIADIEGRCDDVFVYAGERTVQPYVFKSVLARETAVTEYQVRQTPTGAEILLRAREPVNTTPIERNLQAALERLGCPHPAVTTEIVEQLPRLDTGKLKRFVPLNDTPRPPATR
jgi:phenylacetate-coenzyme A ligase PaaK-like adenylate-forming protein